MVIETKAIKTYICTICGYSKTISDTEKVPTTCPACNDGHVRSWVPKRQELPKYVKISMVANFILNKAIYTNDDIFFANSKGFCLLCNSHSRSFNDTDRKALLDYLANKGYPNSVIDKNFLFLKK